MRLRRRPQRRELVSFATLAALAAGSFGAAPALQARWSAAHHGTLEFGRLVGPELRAKPVAALRLGAPRSLAGDGSGRWTWAHQVGPGEDLWRELEGAGALGDPDALLGLIEDLFEAEGEVVDASGDAPDALGFRDAWRVELFSPVEAPSGATLEQRLGEPFLTAELGLASPDGRALMVRLAGEEAIWSIDRNPRYRLEGTLDAGAARRRLSAAPPLADRRLVPASWPGRADGLAALAWQRQGGQSLRLVERPVQRTEEQLRAGLAPSAWQLIGRDVQETFEVPLPSPQGGQAPAMEPASRAAMALLEFAARSEYDELLDPRDAERLGLGPGVTPWAIVLYASPKTEAHPEGLSFTLSIGPPLSAEDGGGHAAIHGAAHNLVRLASPLVEALLASPEDFHAPGALERWRLR